MNRSFLPMGGSLEVNPVELWANATIGAAGAVDAYAGKGVASVTLVSTGRYSVNLTEGAPGFLWADAVVLNTADSNPSSVGVLVRVKSEQVNDALAPNVVFQFYASDDGAVAAPASGAVVYFNIKVRNSSVS